MYTIVLTKCTPVVIPTQVWTSVAKEYILSHRDGRGRGGDAASTLSESLEDLKNLRFTRLLCRYCRFA